MNNERPLKKSKIACKEEEMRMLFDRLEPPTAQSVGYYPSRLSLSIQEIRVAIKEKERKNERTIC